MITCNCALIMIEQECIGIPDMILLLMNFFVSKKLKIKAEIGLSPGGAYFIIGNALKMRKLNE